MLRLLKPHWLDVILLVAITSLVLLLLMSSGFPPASPWPDLWVNATTDLFFVWLVGRVIDGILQARQRRQAAIRELRGGLNTTMRMASDLTPRVRSGLIRDLTNEHRWMNLWISRRRRLLEQDELGRFREAEERLSGIIEQAKELQDLQVETERRMHATEEQIREYIDPATDYSLHMADISEIRAVRQAYDFYQYEGLANSVELLATLLPAAQHTVDAAAYPTPAKELLSELLTSVRDSVAKREQLSQAVTEYVCHVNEAETALLARIED